MKRCKIGDRAFIIKSRFPENIGKIVRVIGQAEFMDWRVESEGSPIKVISVDKNGNVRKNAHWKMRGSCSDGALMPIRGEPEKESEKEKEVA